jgi:hypothetical protein
VFAEKDLEQNPCEPRPIDEATFCRRKSCNVWRRCPFNGLRHKNVDSAAAKKGVEMKSALWLSVGIVATLLGSTLAAVNKAEDDDVVADDVQMTVVIPEVIALPAKGEETKFEISLRIANRTKQEDDLVFDLFDTVRPVLKDAQGRELPLDGGRDGTIVPEPILVKARRTETAAYPARLSLPAGKNLPQLVVDDLTGGVWVYHDLKPGRYTLQLVYAHPPEGRPAQPGRWVGATKTVPVDFAIKAPEDAESAAKPPTRGR